MSERLEAPGGVGTLHPALGASGRRSSPETAEQSGCADRRVRFVARKDAGRSNSRALWARTRTPRAANLAGETCDPIAQRSPKYANLITDARPTHHLSCRL